MSGYRTYEELIERSDSTHLKESAKASFVISYYYVRSKLLLFMTLASLSSTHPPGILPSYLCP